MCDKLAGVFVSRVGLDRAFDALPERPSITEVADTLGVTKRQVYRWLNEGHLPGVKLGATWVLDREELRATVRAAHNQLSGGTDQTDDPT